MNFRRVFLISRNFWPVSGETELLAAAFARELARTAGHLDILTWRMIQQWPDQYQFGRCNVIRLPQNQRSSWSPAALGYYGRNRWHRSLQRWFNSEGRNYDAGIIFEFAQDALAPTVIAGKSGIPVVSRIHQKLIAGVSRNLGRELRSLRNQPVALVTPDQQLLLDPLVSEGSLSGLVFVPDGHPEIADSVPDQAKARDILARVHPIFKLEDNALLVVCGTELTFESGVFSLVRAWRRVLAEQPDARLWLIGTGRNAPELFQRICDLDMQHSVLLTGSFDDVSDVFAAADGFVLPGTGAPGWYADVACQLGLTVLYHRNCAFAGSPATTGRNLPFDDDSRSLDLVLSHWASSHRKSPRNRDFSGLRPTESEVASGVTRMVKTYLARLQQQSIPN